MADFRFIKFLEGKGDKGGGTLISNWQEECDFRDFIGVGR